jgi:hypothetical protein
LGQSLQREGHVDNFLIPVFCRKLFEDNHPSKSGRHHFFPFIGVSNYPYFFICYVSFTTFLLDQLTYFHLVFFFQENILEYNNDFQLGLIAKSFIGATSASKGKRLELSDRVFYNSCFHLRIFNNIMIC